jgi:hypothetical protein
MVFCASARPEQRETAVVFSTYHLADFAMRAIYRHHANGNEAIKNLVSALNVTEHTLHFVMRETPRGWHHSEQTEQPTSADA